MIPDVVGPSASPKPFTASEVRAWLERLRINDIADETCIKMAAALDRIARELRSDNSNSNANSKDNGDDQEEGSAETDRTVESPYPRGVSVWDFKGAASAVEVLLGSLPAMKSWVEGGLFLPHELEDTNGPSVDLESQKAIINIKIIEDLEKSLKDISNFIKHSLELSEEEKVKHRPRPWHMTALRIAKLFQFVAHENNKPIPPAGANNTLAQIVRDVLQRADNNFGGVSSQTVGKYLDRRLRSDWYLQFKEQADET